VKDICFPPGTASFFFAITTRPNLGPTQPRIQREVGAKRPGREDKHPSRAEVMNTWRFTSVPSIRIHGMVLMHGENLNLCNKIDESLIKLEIFLVVKLSNF
jgi:hypothetical protein